MATVMIQRAWPDGETLTISVDVDESFPDVVAEAKRSAVAAYREALGITLAPEGDE